MGMDYQWAGSASYPRFNEELANVVSLFGGIKTTELEEKQKEVSEGSLDWWFGRPMKDNEKNFAFKELVPESFKKWANDPYNENFSYKETKEIFNLLNTKKDEVCEISSQIFEEFETCVEVGDAWYIY